MQAIISATSGRGAPLSGSSARKLLILWIIAGLSAYALIFLLASLGRSAGQTLILISFVAGAVTPGIAQWLVLRRYLQGLTWPQWLRATVIGQAIGGTYFIVGVTILLFAGGLLFPGSPFSLSSVIGRSGSPLVLSVILLEAGMAGGIGAGVYQWRVLAKYLSGHVLRLKSLWVFASAVAGFITGILFLIPSGRPANDLGGTLTHFMLGALVIATGSVVTGVVLTHLLSAPTSPANPAPSVGQDSARSGRVYRVRRNG